MQIDITHRPGNSAAKVSLQAGESITAEGGAIVFFAYTLYTPCIVSGNDAQID